MKTIRPIKSELQYREALKKVDSLIDSQPNTAEFKLLEMLSILVDDYENKHYAIEPLDPTEAIKYEMEENGLKQKDLIQYFGSKEMVSLVLNRKRPLTLRMIKSLYQNLVSPQKFYLPNFKKEANIVFLRKFYGCQFCRNSSDSLLNLRYLLA